MSDSECIFCKIAAGETKHPVTLEAEIAVTLEERPPPVGRQVCNRVYLHVYALRPQPIRISILPVIRNNSSLTRV